MAGLSCERCLKLLITKVDMMSLTSTRVSTVRNLSCDTARPRQYFSAMYESSIVDQIQPVDSEMSCKSQRVRIVMGMWSVVVYIDLYT